ncbi:MAG: cob(I)yrinic acid a,c-diamide adenosyltransferase [Acidimicrobiia bacterium]|nr:cob(I)yrinic acid a,c-diamide adenosyltransferase [Acidimicrobiia bacterium]
MKIYTQKGDDGTTGLFMGGRVSKASLGPEAYGTVDEAVSTLGAARAQADGAMAESIMETQRSMFVCAAELATDPSRRDTLQDGVSRVHQGMIDKLEAAIDEIVDRRGMPETFVVPGGSGVAASLDVARTVIRRAERRAVEYADAGGLEESLVVPFLNRMADYVYMLARDAESEWAPSRED